MDHHDLQKYATDIVLETHETWKGLISGSADKKDIVVYVILKYS